MPLTPKWKDRELTPNEIEERVAAVKQAQARRGRPKATAADLRQEMTAPESTDVRNPASWDIDPFAAMEQDARVEQERKRRAAASRLGLTRRGR